MSLNFQTQNDDLQAEYSKLNMDYQKEKEDQKHKPNLRGTRSNMQLKQEKELELTSLKGRHHETGRISEEPGVYTAQTKKKN